MNGLHCRFFSVAALFAAVASAPADTLTWNGGASGAWNASSANLVWTDGTGAAAAWTDGSDAVFPGAATTRATLSGPIAAGNISVTPGTQTAYFSGTGPLSWTGWLKTAGGHVHLECPLADDGNGLHFNGGGHTYLKTSNRHTGGTYIKNTNNNYMRAFAINGASQGTGDDNDLALGPVPAAVCTNVIIQGGTVALFCDSSFNVAVHANRTILVENGQTFYVSPGGTLRIYGNILGEYKPGTVYPTETTLFCHNQWTGKTILYGQNQIGHMLVYGQAEIGGGRTTVISSGQGTGTNAALWVKGNGSAYSATKGYLLVSGGTLANFQGGYRFETSDYGHLDIAGGTVSVAQEAGAEFLNALSSPAKVTIRDGGLLACGKFRVTQVAYGSTTPGGEVFLEKGGTLRARQILNDFGAKRKGTVHLDGGAIQSIAGNSNVSVTQDPTNANWEGTDFVVEAGGAVFDTSNGQHLFFGRPLLSGVAAGETDGGLTCKLGNGRAVVLTDCATNSTYNGPTRLEVIGDESSGTRSLQCRVANALPVTTTLQVGPGCQAGFNTWDGASGSAQRENADVEQSVARLEGAGYVFYNSLLDVTEAIAPVFDGQYGTLSFEKPFAANCDLEITGDASGCGCLEFKRPGQSVAGLSLKADTTGFDKANGKAFYKIVDAPKGYVGEFASDNLPGNWCLAYTDTAIYLVPVNPFVMVVR